MTYLISICKWPIDRNVHSRDTGAKGEILEGETVLSSRPRNEDKETRDEERRRIWQFCSSN